MHVKTSAFQVLVVIPTVANSETLLPSFERLLKHTDGLSVHIVASVNPLDEEEAEASVAGMRFLWDRLAPEGCALTIYRHPEPCGFGGAINRGIRVGTCATALEIDEEGWALRMQRGSAIRSEGLPSDMVVIFNDDLRVTAGWLLSMREALSTDTVKLMSEVQNEDGTRPDRSISGYGRIGMVGPMTNVAAGIQVVGPENMQRFQDMGLDGFSEWWREQNQGVVYTATFLSGYCMAFHPDLVMDLEIADGEGRPCLFDERYLIAGYEDNDLCARADLKGWRAAVAYEAFIGHLGHQTFDKDFKGMDRGMRNRGIYYDVWRPTVQNVGTNLVAAFRVRLDVPNDVNLFRMAIAGISRLADGIAIVLTGPLADMQRTEEWRQLLEAGTLPADARVLAEAGTLSKEVLALHDWAKQWANHMPGNRGPRVKVQRWQGAFNERDERNFLLDMARGMGADWILSMDHDEVIEPRVGRAHLERLMRHPDPLVQEWDFSWINHWGNNLWQNLSPPWGDGGRFTGGMHGFRMFRVNAASPRQIQAGGTNGLHCGNIPMVGPVAKRVSGIRIRHFGYMRVQDRRRKLARYNTQDPTPNPVLVGGTSYAHIMHQENQLMSAFSPVNGIGVHALMYEGEKATDLGRNLDQLYGVADRIVLVWTGEWRMEDRTRVYGGPEKRGGEANLKGTYRPTADLWDAEIAANWPTTGPSLEVARMAEHFQAEWVYRPLGDDIAGARNAGIDALHGTPGMGWGYFFDPDEHPPGNFGVGLRRMAEVTDTWGWMFRFANVYRDGGSNTSESVRMHRLDERGIMRMSGRVHESFQRAIRHLVDVEDMGSVLRRAPDVMTCTNTGLALEADALQAKFNRYRRLTELELADNPQNPGAWTTLGLFWANEGYHSVAMECFTRGMASASTEFLPFQEAGLAYLRLARLCYMEAGERMGSRGEVPAGIVDFIDTVAPPMPLLGTPGATGMSEEEALASLPAMR